MNEPRAEAPDPSAPKDDLAARDEWRERVAHRVDCPVAIDGSGPCSCADFLGEELSLGELGLEEKTVRIADHVDVTVGPFTSSHAARDLLNLATRLRGLDGLTPFAKDLIAKGAAELEGAAFRACAERPTVCVPSPGDGCIRVVLLRKPPEPGDDFRVVAVDGADGASIVTLQPLTPANFAEPIKSWPFLESPGEFASRLAHALLSALPSHMGIMETAMLAAVRSVLIENPPALADWSKDALTRSKEHVELETLRKLLDWTKQKPETRGAMYRALLEERDELNAKLEDAAAHLYTVNAKVEELGAEVAHLEATAPTLDEVIASIEHQGGRCRDCADAFGICDTGLPCDPAKKREAILTVLGRFDFFAKNREMFDGFRARKLDDGAVDDYEAGKAAIAHLSQKLQYLGVSRQGKWIDLIDEAAAKYRKRIEEGAEAIKARRDLVNAVANARGLLAAMRDVELRRSPGSRRFSEDQLALIDEVVSALPAGDA